MILQDLLYSDEHLPKIHSLSSNELDIESQDSFIGRSHVQQTWVNALRLELDPVASYDPRPHVSNNNNPAKEYFNHDRKWIKLLSQNEPPTESIPEGLLSCAAADYEPGRAGVDLRPHIFDAVSKQHILLDSGSQVSAYPPEPGDQESGTFLKAVNGSKIKCFGTKQITIKIGRKEYHPKVILSNWMIESSD